MNDCSHYWEHADHIPLDDVISYWCELSGQSHAECRVAKHAAICSAVDKGDIKYRRADGRPFEDDVYVLASQKLLLIEKDSFNQWAKQFSASPNLTKQLGNRERETLLTIIATLCKDAGHDHTKAAKTAALIQGTAAQMGILIGETTIEGHLKKIPDALASRMK